MLDDILAILAIALIVGGAVFYIVRAKKKGQKCIGCPYADSCKSSCCCSKSSESNEKSA